MAQDEKFDLGPDPIVSGSNTYNEPVLRLRGYVGEKQDDKVRLYWDISKTGYYEISTSDVVDRIRLSDVDGSLLVVKLSANIGVVESGTVPAAWLQGAITSAFLGETGGGRCETMSPPSTHLPTGCITLSPPSTHFITICPMLPPSTHRVFAGWPPTTRY